MLALLWNSSSVGSGGGDDVAPDVAADVANLFSGAMEEVFVQRISLENITAHLFACPACGCNNFYLW